MEGNKIIMAGLDGAGKTSILQRVFFGADPDEVEQLNPTRGVDREQVHLTPDMIKYVFWELGGQQQYIDQHLYKPQLLSVTQLLIFVIDIQDESRYEISINYLQQLLNLLRETAGDCQVAIVLHKFDPEDVNELRKKQFTLFKLLKSLQGSYSSFTFSQHSTSIHDNTLYYTFQTLFERLGLDIGAYKTKITTDIKLGERRSPETRSEIIISEELIDRFETILESAQNALTHLAPEINELEGVEKFHEITKEYADKFHGIERIDTKRNAVDAISIGYMEYITRITLKYLERGIVDAKEAQLIFLYIAQVNLIKIRFIHFVMNTKLEKINSPLKFMEMVKSLTNDLLDLSFVASHITMDQLEELKALFNGISNPNFSLFDQSNKDVYTFTSIQELKSAFSQDKFIPAKLLLNIELAEKYRDAYVGRIQDIMESTGLASLPEADVLALYEMRLEYMLPEFYQLVVDSKLREYEIERNIEQDFRKISSELLAIANLGNVIGEDEKLQIRQILETFA